MWNSSIDMALNPGVDVPSVSNLLDTFPGSDDVLHELHRGSAAKLVLASSTICRLASL
jgi:hypothetical protein